MTMGPGLRKFVLTAHVTFAVGWLGAVVAYLAVAIAGLKSRDAQTVRSAYIAMELIGRYVLVPLSFATVLAGLVESLATPWGLFRYWWVSVKFVLTAGATAILLRHMAAIAGMADLARDLAWSGDGYGSQRMQLVVHAAGGLLVLLAATALSIYKPWGLTPYGLRRQLRAREIPAADLSLGFGPAMAMATRSASATPRWMYVVGLHAVGVVLLLLIMHLAGGGMRMH